MELILSSGHNFSEYQCYATKINKGRWAGKDRVVDSAEICTTIKCTEC
jgi:hypothetical protein